LLHVGRRIIVSIPTHPAYFLIYFLLLIPLSLVAPSVFGFLTIMFGLSLRQALILGDLIFLLSLILSPINIVLKEYFAGGYTIGFQQRYVSFYGIPIPIITPVIIARKIVLAINVGGALIPLTISILLLIKLAILNIYVFIESFIVIIVTMIISYIFSRAIPGVGIAVPGLIPPLIAALTTLIIIHDPSYAVPVAYIGGVLGSLLGADILRLRRELYKFINIYGASFLSIGGAGTFDGIYLSGLFAVALALLFI
jgi:uncharacterized membrane protein